MSPVKRAVIFIIAVIAGLSSLLAAPVTGSKLFPGEGVVYAQEDWKKEFDDLCSKTQDAMAFSEDELSSLVDRCDKLKPLIENLAEAPRKIYLKRLSMCRDLFIFALESKENK